MTQVAVIRGKRDSLSGAPVMATDLRASASLVLRRARLGLGCGLGHLLERSLGRGCCRGVAGLEARGLELLDGLGLGGVEELEEDVRIEAEVSTVPPWSGHSQRSRQRS